MPQKHTTRGGEATHFITSTQCHGNSTPRAHPDENTASHGATSRIHPCRYQTYTAHTYAQRLLQGWSHLEFHWRHTILRCNITRIIDGIISQQEPPSPNACIHTVQFSVVECSAAQQVQGRVRTSSFTATSAPATINCTAASSLLASTAKWRAVLPC